MTRTDHHQGLDLPTIIAISSMAYALANLVHEGLGHGGACLALGARPLMLNAIFFNYDDAAASDFTRRAIAAAGSIVNVVVALPLLALLRSPARVSPRWRYFLWLFTAVSLLTAFGYLLYSGIGGIGDWARVVEGLPGAVALRIAMAAVGFVLYFIVAPRLLMPALEPFLGLDPESRVARARRLSLIPYFVGGATLIAAGILNPFGMRIVLISAAAASFGGTSLLAWYPTKPRRPAADTPEVPLGVERSVAWIAAAVVVLLVFIFILGPGIGHV